MGKLTKYIAIFASVKLPEGNCQWPFRKATRLIIEGSLQTNDHLSARNGLSDKVPASHDQLDISHWAARWDNRLNSHVWCGSECCKHDISSYPRTPVWCRVIIMMFSFLKVNVIQCLHSWCSTAHVLMVKSPKPKLQIRSNITGLYSWFWGIPKYPNADYYASQFR